jgi:hypothetical protein
MTLAEPQVTAAMQQIPKQWQQYLIYSREWDSPENDGGRLELWSKLVPDSQRQRKQLQRSGQLR